MTTKILWVSDHLDGPYNGMCLEDGKQLWFAGIILSNGEKKFNLLQLTPELEAALKREHEEYCNITGAPIYHGAPRIIKRQTIIKKANIVPDGQEDTEVGPRGLTHVVTFNRKIDPLTVNGKYIKTIGVEDFSNYSVPQMIEILE